MSADEARPLPRFSLAALSAGHAGLFGWLGAMLPWRGGTLFAGACYIVAALHLATALAAIVQHRRLAAIWRAQALGSLAWLAYLGWGVLSSAWYVRNLYQGLGRGVSEALLAVFGLAVLITLPLALWGLAATGGVRPSRRSGGAATLLVILVAGAGWRAQRLAEPEVRIAPEMRAGLVERLAPALDPRALPRLDRGLVPLFTLEPARCRQPVGQGLTLLLTHVAEDGKPAVACLQAADEERLRAAITAHLADKGRFGALKLDVVHEVGRLPAADEPLAALALRPGLDGVCGEDRCLAPWQLVASSSFTAHAPIPQLPEARFGAAPIELERRLGAAPTRRIATTSWVVHPVTGTAVTGRTPSPELGADADSVFRAALTAHLYILDAQRKDGRFDYLVDPFTGQVTMGRFSVARQAGTTLALCEVARRYGQRTTATVERSLHMLAGLEREVGDGALLQTGGVAAVERVGPSALALAAFVTCRPRLGPRHDEIIGRLARSLVATQTASGRFAHALDMATGQIVPRVGELYADGQFVLALLLVERLLDEGVDLGGLDRSLVRATIDRAMDYYAEAHWPGFLRDFFFLEENWHCLAARAALPHHRHDGYERYCLDYVTMKARIQLDADSGVHEDFVGGWGFGNVQPPHNTATAGFGEALAAAIAVARARGEPTTSLEAQLRGAMGFLVRNQWQRGRCFACTGRRRVIGGFSEHMASPIIRIDYVQHAWAALGHGAAVLGLEGGA